MFENVFLQNFFGVSFTLLLFAYVIRWMWGDTPSRKEIASFDEQLQYEYSEEIPDTWHKLDRLIYARISFELQSGATLPPRIIKYYEVLRDSKVRSIVKQEDRISKSKTIIEDAEIVQIGETLTLSQ